ncbi:polysaccharide biosynthesis protein [Marinobacter salinisoli]|uniref:Polysaccharide biosynthesis protein n=1 Tax=Marinobacter salinisoli TaxID=2769486 RepID=A0ABX7MMR4_9GAMM|nr:polysaccharide biosynthesis protein [Marinobacter salinisoli]QSP93516.1 polysaccharide biosynthesis protein [Marinobacter salinisoli]
MDDSKLYNALLKSRDERRQSSHDRERPAVVKEEPRKERHYSSSEDGKPNWVRVDKGDQERAHPPEIYDPSVSLALIRNPKPWSREQLRERKIIYSGMPDKEVMDAYRELRIQLRKRAGEGNFTVMFSSLGNAPGGLLTAFNLATAFALDSHTSALFVDCDPYHHELTDLVSVPMDAGVTDFVADRSQAIKSIIYPSGVERLSVIPAGTQASSAVELFASVRMRDLIAELKDRYPDRCIVLNAPPFRTNAEARILERFADQIVFGVPFGEVTGQVITDSVGALGSDKFSGLVFQE